MSAGEPPSAASAASGSSRPPARRLRFPKSRRLLRRRDFLRVQDRSARVTTAHLVLLLAARPSEGPSRLGVVASKKVGGAVQRNRAKRLVREVFRTSPELFPGGVDLVVIVRPGTHSLRLDEARREVAGVGQVLARRAREVLRK